MPYNKDTPQANDKIATTQPLILQNFQYINTTMQLNHTFNGNAIGTEADGSHQRLDFPNQGADIAALPTGIAAVLYSKGSNLFIWNGAKRPVSGISSSGSIALTTTPGSIGSIADDCIGFVVVEASNIIIHYAQILSFFSISGTVYFQVAYKPQGSFTEVDLSATGTTLKLSVIGTGYTATYKLIYWPI